MKIKLSFAIGVAALALATGTVNAQCSPEPPGMIGFNRINGYVVQTLLSAPAGLRVEFQITLRNRPFADGSWRQLQFYGQFTGRDAYGTVPLFKRRKYTLWARVVDPASGCASQPARWNL